MDILDTIVAHTRKEVAAQKKEISLNILMVLNSLSKQPVYSMRKALANSSSGIIAEFKRKSPSKGWIFPDAKVEDIVPAYEAGGAAACSILTDSEFFGGMFDDISRVRKFVQLPLLRKDFMIDEYQIYQARAMRADAILLIASILTPATCLQFAQVAHQLGMEVLLEIHQEDELDRLNPCIDMLGVNNRNLGTFHTGVENSFRLVKAIQRELGGDTDVPLLVSESGLSDTQTIRELRSVGFRGFLIGETLMKTPQPGKTLKDLICRLNEHDY